MSGLRGGTRCIDNQQRQTPGLKVPVVMSACARFVCRRPTFPWGPPNTALVIFFRAQIADFPSKMASLFSPTI